MKISPICYMGSKRELIGKGLLEYFPKNINTFIDAFAGSLSVSLNVKAKKYIINDKDSNLFSIYRLLLRYTSNREMLVSKLETLRHRFHLPYRGGQYKEDKYIKNYKTLKEYYNKNRKPMCLFLLHYYSFCHIIRFTKGKFDTAIGTNILNNQVKKKIINFDLFDRSVKILNKNYLEIDYSKLSEDDFVYFDPPYFGSMAVYNEGAKERSWTLEEDLLLRKLCDELTKRKIKWGMSNVFLNKGMKSAALKKWALCNKYEIIHFSIKYRSKHLTSGDKESTDEVFICNYKPRYGLFS